MTQDEQHLQLLSIFHYVVGGLIGLFSLFPLLYVVFGLVILISPESFAGRHGESPPAFLGVFLIIFPLVLITIGWVFAGCVIAAGRCLAKKRRYTFCLVMAAIECLFMPFGTILGVFTIVVLVRESVKSLFDSPPQDIMDVSGQ